MWYVQLLIAEDCLEMASRELITKDLNIRRECDGRRRSSLLVFKVKF